MSFFCFFLDPDKKKLSHSLKKNSSLPRHLAAGPRPLPRHPQEPRRAQQALQGLQRRAQGDPGAPALRRAAGGQGAGPGRRRLPRRRQRRRERLAVRVPPTSPRPRGEADGVASRMKDSFR